MTGETKLGLLIGGAFILCFALILSNTGNPRALEHQINTLATATETRPSVGEQADVGKLAQKPPVDPAPKSVVTNETRSPQNSVSPTLSANTSIASNSQSPSFPSSIVIAPTENGVDTQLRQSPPPLHSPSQPTVTDVINNRPSAEGSSPAGAVKHTFQLPTLEGAPAETTSHSGEAPAAAPVATSASDSKSATSTQTYVVSKSDNLTRIAQKFYGTASPQNIERILKANSTAIKDKNATLQVGQKLEIPVDEPPATAVPAKSGKTRKSDPKDKTAGILEALASSGKNPVTIDAATTELNERSVSANKPVNKGDKKDKRIETPKDKSSNPADEKWVWYQVKPTDTLAKIAKEQLGSEKRWKEIHDINKDKFPDPTKIRPGVRIKIPTDATT